LHDSRTSQSIGSTHGRASNHHTRFFKERYQGSLFIYSLITTGFNAEEAPPSYSLQQPNNKSKRLKKNLVNEFVSSYIEKHWNHDRVPLPDTEDDDTPSSSSSSSSQETKYVEPNEEVILRLSEMGFDRTSVRVALEDTKNDESRALDKLLSGGVFVTDDLRQLMDMGFSFTKAQQALTSFGGNVERALDHLLTHGIEDNGTQKKGSKVLTNKNKGGFTTFTAGLVYHLRHLLMNYKSHCCICQAKHSCNR
jgi:hypothetical protein